MKRSLIIDALCLQFAWFSCAILHDQAFPWVVIFLVIQLFASSTVISQLLPALIVTLAGLVLEVTMISTGLIDYSSAYPMPLWLPVLWVIFAFTFGNSLHWLASIGLVPQALLGAVFGCLTYQAATSFDVLQLYSDRITSGVILFAVWAVALPLLFYVRGLTLKGQNFD